MDRGGEVSLNPQPIPPGRMALYRALGEVVVSIFADEDGISGSVDPHGPGGPVMMRDVAAAMVLSQVASVLSDAGVRRETQELAARIAKAALP